MLRIALLHTRRSAEEKDLGKMIMHLLGVLSDIENTHVVGVVLESGIVHDYSSYNHLVFCGYDHVTFAHLHLAMATTDPDKTRITLYDEPGASVERELGTLLYAGIDRRRIDASSATRLIYSWSHRDLVATTKQDVLKYENGPGTAGTTSNPEPAQSEPGPDSGADRARQVENKRAASTRKRTRPTGDEKTKQ